MLICTACRQEISKEELDNIDKLFTSLPSAYTGLSFENTLTETKENNHLVNDEFITGAGLAVGDINKDGLPDIFITGNQVEDRLYLNKGNLRFEDITEQAGIAMVKTWSTGVTMADVNNDGHLDIYICKNVHKDTPNSKNLLYINNGDLTFTESGEKYALNDKGFSVQATFFDYDKDGLTDMYLVNQPPSVGGRNGGKINPQEHVSLLYTDKIYKNMGGEFADISDYTTTRNFAYGLSATVADFNQDLWPDVYVCNDFDKPDHLYMNQRNGKFRNTINTAVKHTSNFSMGSDAADYNNDGLIDLMVLDMVAEDHKRIKTYMGGMQPEVFWDIVNKGWHYQYMFNTLQKNNGNGTFSEVAQIGGVSNTDWSWGPLFADFDNDGWKDLFVTNGIKRNMRQGDLNRQYTEVLDSLEKVAALSGEKLNEMIDVMEFVNMAPVDKIVNYVFKNNGDLTFEKKQGEWGIDIPSMSNGAAYADFDGDGDLDLVINNVDEEVFFYRNNAMERNEGNYLRFQVVNKWGAPSLGTQVHLYHNGRFWQMQELTNARGYMSKSEDILHFGIKKEKVVDSAMIVWSDGKKQVIKDLEANKLISLKYDEPSLSPIDWKTPKDKLFKEVTKEVGIAYFHKENDYDDYARELLLPHKMSNFGPGLAVGDVNRDGLEDFFVGAAMGHTAQLFVQKEDATFEAMPIPVFEEDKVHEDLGALFFDADNDGDDDLYVVSGGNEFEAKDKRLQDRLYLNDGKGRWSKAKDRLPEMLTSGSVVSAGDYDNDGDLDLFVGGRVVPGAYPLPARSYLLENNRGHFTDVTETIAPELLEPGLVTAATWTDFSGDGRLDMVVTGEWMPLMLMENEGDGFKNKTVGSDLEKLRGWYFQVRSADFDNDGDQDFIAGNLGLNYKYKADKEAPFEVYSDDFDGNGSRDIVLSYYEHGEAFPVRGKSCSSEQIPKIDTEFPTYESFGDANLSDIYGAKLQKALYYAAENFASLYIENRGKGDFKARVLPNEAQISSINNILIDDYDRDGNMDILISGNLYASEIETPRNDAGMGLFLKGDGHGHFEPVPLLESGFFAPHDAKAMAKIALGKGRDKKQLILVANNSFWLQAIQCQY